MNFDFPRGVYFPYEYWTDRNLFNLYHKKYVDEVTDKDSKVIRAYMHLTAYDISKLDFRNRILVDGHWLRLNKITDWNVGKNIPVLCEFLKLKDKPAFVSRFSNVVEIEPPWNPSGRAINNFTQPHYMLGNNDSNQGKVNGQISMQGIGNVVDMSASRVFINGDNNIVDDNAYGVFIEGNNNRVGSGLRNVSIINTDNVTVTESNVAYLNGLYVSPGGVLINTNINIIDSGEDEVLNPFSSGIINLIDAGEDVVRSLGSNSTTNVIDAGEDKIV